MTETTLVIGGARSGKSGHAQSLARARSDAPIYLATSRIWDEDHAARIEHHRRDRGPEWTTIEEQKELSRIGIRGEPVVVDCLTLWLTNYFVEMKEDHEQVLEAVRSEFDRALALANEWIFVTNEVGQSLHAPTEAGRKFTDLQGFMNQYAAARVERVIWMCAGIPVVIKGRKESA